MKIFSEIRYFALWVRLHCTIRRGMVGVPISMFQEGIARLCQELTIRHILQGDSS